MITLLAGSARLTTKLPNKITMLSTTVMAAMLRGVPIWTSQRKFNASLNASVTYQYNKEKFNGYTKVNLRTGLVGSAYDYHYVELTNVLRASVWKLDFRTRAFMRIGTGRNTPSESMLFFAGGNPEDMMDNKYYRAAGFMPPGYVGTYRDDIGHFHFGGGLNMRG